MLVLVEVVLGRDVDVLEDDDVVDDVDVELLDVVGRVDEEVEVDVELVLGTLVDVDVDVVVGLLVDVDVEVVVGLLVDVDVEVVVLVDVDVDDVVVVVVDDVGPVVVDDVELVVGTAVDVELDDDVDVAGRVLDVLVVELEVVVVLFLRAMAVVAHTQPLHGSPGAQSAAGSHSSPAAPSTTPSPHVEAAAVKRRRGVARAESVPPSDVHAGSSTLATRRTPRSPSHAAQRTRTFATVPRRVTRARAGPQSAIDAFPSASTTNASNDSAVAGRNAGSTRKRTPGQGGGAAAAVRGSAAISAATSNSAQRAAIVEVSTLAGRECAAGPPWKARCPRRRSSGMRHETGLECDRVEVRGMARGQPVQTSDRERAGSTLQTSPPSLAQALCAVGRRGQNVSSRTSSSRSSICLRISRRQAAVSRRSRSRVRSSFALRNESRFRRSFCLKWRTRTFH